jgi:hypothetical protein
MRLRHHPRRPSGEKKESASRGRPKEEVSLARTAGAEEASYVSRSEERGNVQREMIRPSFTPLTPTTPPLLRLTDAAAAASIVALLLICPSFVVSAHGGGAELPMRRGSALRPWP